MALQTHDEFRERRPQLRARSDTLSVHDNAALATLTVPLLTTVGTLTITNNKVLPTCQAQAILGRLTTVGSSDITMNDPAGTCP